MDKQVISFYYPSQDIGGAQLLFARTAEFLQKSGFSIKIYEETESYISKFLKSKKVNFTIVNLNNEKFKVGEAEIFLLSLSFLTLIFPKFQFNRNTRFVFWDLHPFCLIEQTVFSGFYKTINNGLVRGKFIKLFDYERRGKINSLIKIGTEKNGVLFMCNYNVQFNKNTFGFKNQVELLPIPIEINNSNALSIKDNEGKIRIGWISRLERDKNQILTLLIDDIVKLSPQKLELIIIGNGSDEKFINEYVKRKGVSNIKFVGKIETDDLSKFIVDNIDIGFSMGTSALEFALRKIPSVLVPAPNEFKYFTKDDKRYEWLKDIGGYDVCTYKTETKSYKTFSSILSLFLENKQSLSNESYDYVIRNHSIEALGNKLISILNKCELSYMDLIDIRIDKFTGLERILFSLKKTFKKFKDLANILSV